MSDQKKITRREAIKVLGAAAGASLLANIPSKWSKPKLIGGNIPSHAQISGLLIVDGGFISLRDEANAPVNSSIFQVNNPAGTGSTYFFEHYVQISAAIKDIPLVLVTKSLNNPIWESGPNGSAAPDDVYLTDINGRVSFQFVVSNAGNIEFVWNFQNPSDGDDLTIFPMLGGFGFGNT